MIDRREAARAARQAIYEREIPGERVVFVVSMMGRNTRLCIGDVFDMYGYDDAWCYHDRAECIRAAETWTGDGDPPGPWRKHINTGRRNPPDDFDRDVHAMRLGHTEEDRAAAYVKTKPKGEP